MEKHFWIRKEPHGALNTILVQKVSIDTPTDTHKVYERLLLQSSRHVLRFLEAAEQRATLCVSKRTLVFGKAPSEKQRGSIISWSWLIQRQWRKEKREGGGVRRWGEWIWGSARVFSLGFVVYKQTWRKQSSEECKGREKG